MRNTGARLRDCIVWGEFSKPKLHLVCDQTTTFDVPGDMVVCVCAYPWRKLHRCVIEKTGSYSLFVSTSYRAQANEFHHRPSRQRLEPKRQRGLFVVSDCQIVLVQTNTRQCSHFGVRCHLRMVVQANVCRPRAQMAIRQIRRRTWSQRQTLNPRTQLICAKKPGRVRVPISGIRT